VVVLIQRGRLLSDRSRNFESPSGPGSPAIVILCQGEQCRAHLRQAAQRRFPGVNEAVLLTRWHGDIASVIRETRDVHGGAVLGAIVDGEAQALLALEAGADEARAGALDEGAAFAFIDRAMLRGRLRQEQAQLRASYVHDEKLTALGTLVAGVAHEINNPLTAMLLSTEALRARVGPLATACDQAEALLQRQDPATGDELLQLVRAIRGMREQAPGGELRELLQEIEGAGSSIAQIVQDLKVFSRQDDELAPEVVDVRALIDQVLRLVGRQLRSAASLELDHQADLPLIVAPAARLAQVLTNVLLNAAHAVGDTARAGHRVRISTRADDEAVAICVTDTGPGIPAEAIDRIFDPFFTTKRPGVGTGLGLSISRSILRRLGGDLLVESVHGEGATFIALIPRPSRRELARVRPPRTEAPPATTQRHQDRVLVVDADERVLRAFARALEQRHDVLLARDADEAIDLLASGSQADVVVADVAPPDAPGLALFPWLLRERPALARAVLFTTPADQSRPSVAGVAEKMAAR
jgi:two-component system cell cycle sensor histidine kinase/response regulator CckA